jgi:hypothetical protein
LTIVGPLQIGHLGDEFPEARATGFIRFLLRIRESATSTNGSFCALTEQTRTVRFRPFLTSPSELPSPIPKADICSALVRNEERHPSGDPPPVITPEEGSDSETVLLSRLLQD